MLAQRPVQISDDRPSVESLYRYPVKGMTPESMGRLQREASATMPLDRTEVIDCTVRCEATNVDPQTAKRDMAIPGLLRRIWGHYDLGMYAKLTAAGGVARGLSPPKSVRTTST